MDSNVKINGKTAGIVINTGNILTRKYLSKNLTKTGSDELANCLTHTVADWADNACKNRFQNGQQFKRTKNDVILKSVPEVREKLRLTVKIFINVNEKVSIEDIVDNVLNELCVSYIETVILAAGPVTMETNSLFRESWASLERLVEQDKIFTLGVADLDARQLHAMYNWAKVRPSLLQVNTAMVSAIPEELKNFALENDLLMLTHTDTVNMLGANVLQKVLLGGDLMTRRTGSSWRPSWCIRYTMINKSRGILRCKGYLLQKDCGANHKTDNIIINEM